MAVFSSAASGGWDTPATWGGLTYPHAGDTVTINAAHAITCASATACATLTIANTGSLNTTALNSWSLTISSALILTGTLTCNNSAVSCGSGVGGATWGVTINTTGTLTGGTGAHTYSCIKTLGNGVWTATTGTTTLNAPSASNGVMYLSQAFTFAAGTVAIVTNTTLYSGIETYVASANYRFFNLTLNSTGTLKTCYLYSNSTIGTLTVGGDLTVTSGTIWQKLTTYTGMNVVVVGAVNIAAAGVYDVNIYSMTVTGNVTTTYGSAFTIATAGSFLNAGATSTFNGNFTSVGTVTSTHTNLTIGPYSTATIATNHTMTITGDFLCKGNWGSGGYITFSGAGTHNLQNAADANDYFYCYGLTIPQGSTIVGATGKVTSAAYLISPATNATLTNCHWYILYTSPGYTTTWNTKYDIDVNTWIYVYFEAGTVNKSKMCGCLSYSTCQFQSFPVRAQGYDFEVSAPRSGGTTYTIDNVWGNTYACNIMLVDANTTIRLVDGITLYCTTFTNNGTWNQGAGYGGLINTTRDPPNFFRRFVNNAYVFKTNSTGKPCIGFPSGWSGYTNYYGIPIMDGYCWSIYTNASKMELYSSTNNSSYTEFIVRDKAGIYNLYRTSRIMDLADWGTAAAPITLTLQAQAPINLSKVVKL